MDILSVRWSAKYGHFLRAEANVNAITYPVPPRTAVLGLVAAILGLEKDALAIELAELQVAVRGAVPMRFWHRVKLRKDPPNTLPYEIKSNQRGSDSPAPEKATLHRQEWLLKPQYELQLAWPTQPTRFNELVERIEQRRWHFTPCMGLSELLSDVEFIDCQSAMRLPLGLQQIQGLCPVDEVRLIAEQNLGVHLLRLPRHVSANRVFSHAPYYLEHQGRSFTVETAAAWQTNNWTGVFL
ncbi:hypothetical protein CKO09_10290 [Chromatium weissei]|nr:hypothetical protein [Chromatium weissei]